MFYSEDTLKVAMEEHTSRKKRPNRRIANISEKLQHVIWNLPHSSADKQVPGKLSLCIGMPVIIKCNAATELCITNGQEAIVVGWQSVLGTKKQLLLDTLFVKLINPPTSVTLDGLPQDVVPLTRTTSSITCRLPDDSKIGLSRSQVEVLPNFAMTDFASQGKTRPYNPVDLFNCRSHQAYYTALSRSATAEGTIILQGFDAKKITGRASRALRQEFRDLELLDEITKSKYESKLPLTVCGERRNNLIHAYRKHKGMSYVPSLVHHSIRWNKSDPMLDPIEDNMQWKILQKSDITTSLKGSDKNNSFIPAKGSAPLNSGKRKHEHNDQPEEKPAKRQHQLAPSTSSDNLLSISTNIPSGFSWHHNSCAYDAALSILHPIWNNDRVKWDHIFRNMNESIMGPLLNNFKESSIGKLSLNSCRDNLRLRLHQLSPQRFAWGRFTGISAPMECLLATDVDTIERSIHCYNHHIEDDVQLDNKSCLIVPGGIIPSSVQSWMSGFREGIVRKCSTCQGSLYRQFRFAYALPIVALDISGHKLEVNTTFNVTTDGDVQTYKLRGIIYFANFHFTSRIINENGMTWFHDGIATADSVIYEGMIDTLDISECRGKQPSIAVYIKA